MVQRIPGSVQTTSIRERCQISDHQSGQKLSERTVPDETDGGRAVTEEPGAEKKLALSLFFLFFMSRLSHFRVQFVCNPCGNNGHYGHFFALFVDIMDTMDIIIRCGHFCR